MPRKKPVLTNTTDVRRAVSRALNDSYEPLTCQQLCEALPEYGARWVAKVLTDMVNRGTVIHVGYIRNKTKLYVSA